MIPADVNNTSIPSVQSAPPVEQLLAQMSGPMLPEPPGVWPLAPGWWLMAIFVVCMVAAVFYLLSKRHKNNRYRKTALLQLEALGQAPLNAASVFKTIAVLKQTLFTCSPHYRHQLAAQFGEPFLHRLQQTCDLSKLPPDQQQSLARYFSDALYQQGEQLQDATAIKSLITAAKYWVKHHKPLKPQPQTSHAESSNITRVNSVEAN